MQNSYIFLAYKLLPVPLSPVNKIIGFFPGYKSVDYRKSTIDKAKNGMIYFDNVHLIPEKYKSIIYDLIEMSSIKENNFMFVLSSDYFNENDLKSNALDNISIKIDLPSLDKRGLVERLEIVQECFKNEEEKSINRLLLNLKP